MSFKSFLFGDDGETSKDVFDSSAGLRGLKRQGKLASSKGLQEAMMQYVDPRSATRKATGQVMNNEMLSGLFGKDGVLNSRIAEEKDLAGRGYSLQAEDHEAFGQASDDIARRSGQEEQALMQAMASRGMAAAPSGAATVGFSGLMGNKFERLANQQRQIAQSRMDTNRQRLSDIRGAVDSMGNQAQGALNDQFGRNMAGVEMNQNMLKDAMEASAQQQLHKDNQFAQRNATASTGLAGHLGNMGLTAGYSAAGSLGSAAGEGLGNKMFGGGGTAAPVKQNVPTQDPRYSKMA